MLSAIVGRDDDIEAIVGPARQTRKPPPRWLWITAAVVGAICAVGFAMVVFGDRGPSSVRSSVPAARRVGDLGFGTGLLIGAGVGVVVGFSLGRQRRSHSSRSSP